MCLEVLRLRKVARWDRGGGGGAEALQEQDCFPPRKRGHVRDSRDVRNRFHPTSVTRGQRTALLRLLVARLSACPVTLPKEAGAQRPGHSGRQ